MESGKHLMVWIAEGWLKFFVCIYLTCLFCVSGLVEFLCLLIFRIVLKAIKYLKNKNFTQI